MRIVDLTHYRCTGERIDFRSVSVRDDGTLVVGPGASVQWPRVWEYRSPLGAAFKDVYFADVPDL